MSHSRLCFKNVKTDSRTFLYINLIYKQGSQSYLKNILIYKNNFKTN